MTQNYLNFELIIIDDFSSDKSLKIINKYRHIKNVKIFKSKERFNNLQIDLKEYASQYQLNQEKLDEYNIKFLRFNCNFLKDYLILSLYTD